MKLNQASSKWKAVLEGNRWNVLSSENKIIASVEKSSEDEANAKLICSSRDFI
jgi:hypothetical protein